MSLARPPRQNLRNPVFFEFFGDAMGMIVETGQGGQTTRDLARALSD